MLSFIAASVLLWSADALLFPNNNGAEPEPELLLVCPAPKAPIGGSIKCDYSLFDLKCSVQCDANFRLSDNSRQFEYKCDLFEGLMSAPMPTCIRTGGSVVVTTPSSGTGIGTGTGVTGFPSTATNCVSSLNDCLNRVPGDYAYCANCRMFATCASSGFYVRDCPGISVFSQAKDKCTEIVAGSCRI